MELFNPEIRKDLTKYAACYASLDEIVKDKKKAKHIRSLIQANSQLKDKDLAKAINNYLKSGYWVSSEGHICGGENDSCGKNDFTKQFKDVQNVNINLSNRYASISKISSSRPSTLYIGGEQWGTFGWNTIEFKPAFPIWRTSFCDLSVHMETKGEISVNYTNEMDFYRNRDPFIYISESLPALYFIDGTPNITPGYIFGSKFKNSKEFEKIC